MLKKILIGIITLSISVSIIACGKTKEVKTVDTVESKINKETTEEFYTEEITKEYKLEESSRSKEEATTKKVKENKTEQVTTEEIPTEAKTETETQKIKVTSSKKKATKERAERFIGLTVSEMVDNIGKYSSKKKTKVTKGKYTCTFYYDDFQVKGKSAGNDWIITSVE